MLPRAVCLALFKLYGRRKKPVVIVGTGVRVEFGTSASAVALVILPVLAVAVQVEHGQQVETGFVGKGLAVRHAECWSYNGLVAL